MDIFPSFILLIHVTFSYYSSLLSIFVFYIVTLYTLPMPIYCTFKFQIVTFCLCNFSFFKVSYCNCFCCNDFCRLGQSQTYPEEERPCLSKYWNGKIYFPDREISLALILFVLQFIADWILYYRIRYFYFVAVVLASTVTGLH